MTHQLVRTIAIVVALSALVARAYWSGGVIEGTEIHLRSPNGQYTIDMMAVDGCAGIHVSDGRGNVAVLYVNDTEAVADACSLRQGFILTGGD